VLLSKLQYATKPFSILHLAFLDNSSRFASDIGFFIIITVNTIIKKITIFDGINFLISIMKIASLCITYTFKPVIN